MSNIATNNSPNFGYVSPQFISAAQKYCKTPSDYKMLSEFLKRYQGTYDVFIDATSDKSGRINGVSVLDFVNKRPLFADMNLEQDKVSKNPLQTLFNTIESLLTPQAQIKQ